MSLSRWVVVSNRLPVVYDKEKASLVPSAGGLVTAIGSVEHNEPVLWVGCAPDSLPIDDWQELLQTWRGTEQLAPVVVEQELYDSYYNGFNNDVLWPLLHYETTRVQSTPEAWNAYVEVNQRFANCLKELLQPGDIIWIHDFHLFLLPALLRAQGVTNRIGFFLHVPFPSSEVFRLLPTREQVLRGILGADLIGFHDYSYLRHFCSTVLRVLGLDSSFLSLTYEQRVVRLGVFPVSIDTTGVARIAASKKVTNIMAKLPNGLFAFLGVDRLDYSKGLDLKLAAYRRLLEQHSELRGKVQLIQLAVPTRTEVPEYRELKQDFEQRVAELNGIFARPDWTPVQYMYAHIPLPQLLALYRSADALLITSKRDGMNLVALEYLAAQDPNDPGVVLLSEFAGALSMLSYAIAINPWDAEQTSERMYQAVSMPLEQQRNSWRHMYNYLAAYNATSWARSFMTQLTIQSGDSAQNRARFLKPKRGDALHILRQLQQRNEQKLVILLDYDGTLVPIHASPELARMTPEMLTQLQTVLTADIEVYVVSGRPRRFLEQELGDLPLTLVAEHGAEIRSQSRKHWRTQIRSQRSLWYATARKIMQDYTRRVPNSLVETKNYSIAWHYRRAPEEYGEYQACKLMEELELGLANLPITMLHGKKVIEVRAGEANKGAFTASLLNQLADDVAVLAIGDDATDEDMFEAVGDRGVCISVERCSPHAGYALARQDEVLPFLQLIADVWRA